MKQLINLLVQLKQWILSVIITCLYYLNRKLHLKVVNSSFWFNIYYKHTTQHKADLKRVNEGVLRIRKESIGW